jgi:hypothetical protein
MKSILITVLVVSVFVGLIVNVQSRKSAKQAEPEVAPATNKGLCQYSINGRNMTLSKKVEFATEFCVRLGDGIRTVMQAHIYDATHNLGASIERFGPKDGNRSVDCNISVFDYRMPLPLMSTEDECHRLQSFVNLEAEAAAYRHLDTIRRSMGLPDDDVIDESQQRASLTPHISCEFGPYGVSIKHWIKSDCKTAKVVYSECAKRLSTTREGIFKCFTDAVWAIEDQTDDNDADD